MGMILSKLTRVLVSHTFLFALVFLILLLVFLSTRAPELLITNIEKKLEADIKSLEAGKTLVGEYAEKAQQITKDLERTRQTIVELQNQRDALQSWLRRVRDWFPGSDVESEINELEKKLESVNFELQILEEDLQDVHEKSSQESEQNEGREIAIEDRRRQINDLRELQNTISDVLDDQMIAIAWKALAIVFVILVAPYVWRILAFHIIAPVAERSLPIRLLSGEGDTFSTQGLPESRPAIRLYLSEGDELLLKERFLQSSTEDSQKRTRYIFSREYFFTSLASGLYMLTEISRKDCARHENVEVTVSCDSDPTIEMSEVAVPAGHRLCFRPSYLVGLVYPTNVPPQISSKWIFDRLHAWLNLRFRYLLIEGPVKLVLAASRGVQFEAVDGDTTGRRVNSTLTVAFSPTLTYSPARAETFWAYFRGANPLFDDFFSGTGVVIQQQVGDSRAGVAARFWETLFGAVRKIFGL